MPSVQLEDWLSTFDRLQAFFVNPCIRPYLESYFASYQWPTPVREEDVRLFLECWEAYWCHVSASGNGHDVACVFISQ